MQGRLFIWVGLALLLLALCLTAGVSLGSAAIPAETVWSILVNKLAPGTFEPTWSPGRESIVWDVRFPRVILAGLVGAGLATVGAVLQSVTRNPLADPHLLGVSSGGALGAIIALLHTGLIFGLVTVPLFAFAGSLLATLAVVAVTRFTGAGADRLVLSGVAIAFVATSLGNLAIFLGDPRAAHTVVFWMLGGLGLAQWSHLLYPAIVLFGCLTFLTIRAREINAMAMGDETAATLGVPVARFRAELFVVTALLTGVMVAFSGAIGFVGLLVPHFVRLTKPKDICRAPAGALQISSRTIVAPEDMPIGVITGLAGGLAFIFLLRRR